MSMKGTILGGAAIESMIKRREVETLKAVQDGMLAVCVAGVAQVKANASGAPGPKIRTADYVGSIEHRIRVTKSKVEGWIGTNRPQGRRLELGFVGKDRLGRHYNQAPRPHFGPVSASLQTDFRAEIERRIGRRAS